MSGRQPPQNSTTVRSLFSSLQRVSPHLAAQVAAAVMFRTHRHRSSDWERDITNRAEQLEVEGPCGKLAVQRWGRGPLVMLVHGWNGRGSQLGAFVPPLLQAGYQVVTFDAPGHGRSAGSTSSLVHFANAFDAVLDAVRPFFQPLTGIVAHSLGGAAVLFALSRAERRQSWVTEPGARRPRLVFFAPPIDLHDFVLTVSEELGLQKRVQTALQHLVERRIGERMDDLHALRLARTMQSPLLVIHDEKDRAVPFSCGERLVQAWPGAELKRTSGLGHGRTLRDSNCVAAALSFLAAERSAELEPLARAGNQ